jgi:hypothetical protein
MPVAAVVVARTSSGTLRLLFRVALGERRRLALGRPPGIFEELLQLDHPGITYGERISQLGDAPFEADDSCGQFRQGGGVIAREGVTRRNSPRYARSSIGWWTPLSKYDPFKLNAGHWSDCSQPWFFSDQQYARAPGTVPTDVNIHL